MDIEALYLGLCAGVKHLLTYSTRYGQGRSVSHTKLFEWMSEQMRNDQSVYSAYPEDVK